MDDFIAWLDANNYPWRPGRGDYQLIQVQVDGSWYPIYDRNNAIEHVTVYGPVVRVVRAFIRERKARR
jgi:hypothetical protein